MATTRTETTQQKYLLSYSVEVTCQMDPPLQIMAAAMRAVVCHKRWRECLICPCHFSAHVLDQCACCIAASINHV